MNFYEALLHYVSAKVPATWSRSRNEECCCGCVAAPIGAKKLSKLGVRAPLCCPVFFGPLGVCYPLQGTTRKLHVLLDSNVLEMIMGNQVQFLLSL